MPSTAAEVSLMRRESPNTILQVKLQLLGVSKPPIWRRLLVRADMTLDRFDAAIQAAMGWYDCHLHAFTTSVGEYGPTDADLVGCGDERRVTVGDVLPEPGSRLRYTYDFGDGWEHDVVLEKILRTELDQLTPVCTAGKGACPPEDCGGAWGYQDLKDALADPAHERHEELLEWLAPDGPPDFDPACFVLEDANERLVFVADVTRH
jgi:Plasmid pRiA4b ORF-3-like protein